MEKSGLKSHDIVVLLQLLIVGPIWRYEQLEESLGFSKSIIHRSLARCSQSNLLNESQNIVFTNALTEFIIHGLKYAFPAKPGNIIRGVPTAHSAEPLKREIVSEKDVYVWPYVKGKVRGQSIQPLHILVPEMALRNTELYELLALIDAIRVGRAREKGIATEMIEERLRKYARANKQ